MKTLRYLLLICFSVLLVCACAKADQEFQHTDCSISAIYISPAFGTRITVITGVINQDTGEISFPIPRKERPYYDLTKLKVRANVGYDAMIEPSLSGIKDLSEPYHITVSVSGKSKEYTLEAYYEM